MKKHPLEQISNLLLSGTGITYVYLFIYISGKAFDDTISLVVEVGKISKHESKYVHVGCFFFTYLRYR